MLHRDYFMRQMEQAVRLMQMALGLIKLQDYPEAFEMLDDGFQRFFGVNSTFVNAMPIEYLLSMLTQGEMLDKDGCLLMATMLKTEGEIYEASGDDERCYHRYVRALSLILKAFESQRQHNCPPEWAEVDDLMQKLAQFELPLEMQEQLFGYYYAVGHYAKAEDFFWQWIEAGEFNKNIIDSGREFYNMLLRLSDEALLAGGLPRREVQAGLEEILPYDEAS